MTRDFQRTAFGAAAFLIAALVIALVLSPFVPEEKEAIANVILGNVLGWPAMVLAYHYGTTAGSQRKTELMAQGEGQ